MTYLTEMATLLLNGRDLCSLKVGDLRVELKSRGLATKGAKAALIDRLKQVSLNLNKVDFTALKAYCVDRFNSNFFTSVLCMCN